MECGECTLCCELFPVMWLHKPANTPCIYCDKGCTIHEDKDDECKDFNCMYRQVDAVDFEFRPDHSHIIFERHDDIIWGTKDPGREISSKGMRQIHNFKEQGFSVAFGDGTSQPQVALAEGHTIEYVKEKIEKFIADKYGSASLLN